MKVHSKQGGEGWGEFLTLGNIPQVPVCQKIKRYEKILQNTCKIEKENKKTTFCLKSDETF